MARAISDIAREIKKDWKKVNYAAVPYLDAMLQLSSVNESYGADSAKSIIRYFLSNASTYRGDTAKKLKAELKSLVGN